MATGDYTYGTVTRLEALVGDLVTSRTFSGSTVPTTTEAEAILDDIAAEINAELEASRYTLETASDLATNQPRISEFLIAVNSWGAAAVVLSTHPSASYAPGNEVEGPIDGRANAYRARYNAGLKRIQEKRLAMTRSAIRMKVGSAEDGDGNTKKPIFTRDLTDYPSTRSLTKA